MSVHTVTEWSWFTQNSCNFLSFFNIYLPKHNLKTRLFVVVWSAISLQYSCLFCTYLYTDTRAKHLRLYTLIQNGHSYCKYYIYIYATHHIKIEANYLGEQHRQRNMDMKHVHHRVCEHKTPMNILLSQEKFHNIKYDNISTCVMAQMDWHLNQNKKDLLLGIYLL